MRRRDFITRGTLATAALALPRSVVASQAAATPAGKPARFKLKYAPFLGQFKALAGPDIATQIQFMADQGFTAMFDNGIMNRPVEQQDLIVRELARQGMTLGPFVLYADFPQKSFVPEGTP